MTLSTKVRPATSCTTSGPKGIHLIYRQVSFSLETFDRLKDWQRHWERTEGCHLDNSRAVERLILMSPLPR